MHPYRQYLFRFLAIILLCGTIYSSWSFGKEALREPGSAKKSSLASLEEKVFVIQSRLLIGALHYIEEMSQQSDQQKNSSQTLLSLIRSAHVSSIFEASSLDTLQPLSVILKKIILSRYLSAAEKTETLLSQLPEPEDEAQSRLVALVKENAQLSNEDSDFLIGQLGWFGDLHAFTLAEDSLKREALSQKVFPEAVSMFQKFTVMLLLLIPLGTLSFCAFGVIVYRLYLGKLQIHYSVERAVAPYCLEVFCLYLVSMLALSLVVDWCIKNGVGLTPLTLNLLGVACLPILLFWPCFFGVSWKDVRQAIGLRITGASKFVRDVMIGPFGYFATLTLILLIVVPYSLVMHAFGVHPEQAAHPVVPILLKASNTQTLLILIFGVLVAPAVEEIMFRGCLYGWLRSFCPPVAAIFISAVIFAVVHPQGPVGVVPLSVIGISLGFLREWRGSLVSCFIAHACVNGGTFFLLLNIFK